MVRGEAAQGIEVLAARQRRPDALSFSAGGFQETPPIPLRAAFLAGPDDRLIRGHACKHGDDGPGRPGVSLTSGGARMMKAHKQFPQDDDDFHAPTLRGSASSRINRRR